MLAMAGPGRRGLQPRRRCLSSAPTGRPPAHAAPASSADRRDLQGDGQPARPARHSVALGLPPGGTTSVCRPTAGTRRSPDHRALGKSTLATALTERMVERGFQFSWFDPEGDDDDLEHSVVVGSAKTPASAEEALDLLREPVNNAVINTLALGMDERPPFFADLLPQLASLRGVVARPHWLVIDEAHHLLPMTRGLPTEPAQGSAGGGILITVHPESVVGGPAKLVDTVIALGEGAPKVIEAFCGSVGIAVPQGLAPPGDNRAPWWSRGDGGPPREVTVAMPRQKHKRHTRKYAEGDLGDESFRFRGPHGKLDRGAEPRAVPADRRRRRRRDLRDPPAGRRLLALVLRRDQGRPAGGRGGGVDRGGAVGRRTRCRRRPRAAST